MIDLSSFIPYLAILLPVLMPFLGDTLASILAQDGFPRELNNIIAWLFLILAAVVTAFASNQLTGNANQLIGVVAGSIQLLLSGPLTSLKPWVNLTALLQSRAFNVVPASSAVSVPLAELRVAEALAPLTPMPVQPPVAQPAQLTVIQPEVSSGTVAQSPAPQFKAPTPGAEHPPIEPGMMVNTLPTLPAFGQPTK